MKYIVLDSPYQCPYRRGKGKCIKNKVIIECDNDFIFPKDCPLNNLIVEL